MSSDWKKKQDEQRLRRLREDVARKEKEARKWGWTVIAVFAFLAFVLVLLLASTPAGA